MVSIMKIEPDTDLPFHPGDRVLYKPSARVYGLPPHAHEVGVVGRVVRCMGGGLVKVDFGTFRKPNEIGVRADQCTRV